LTYKNKQLNIYSNQWIQKGKSLKT
jgi:hypothetical protein